jgi:hypothetical protein
MPDNFTFAGNNFSMNSGQPVGIGAKENLTVPDKNKV